MLNKTKRLLEQARELPTEDLIAAAKRRAFRPIIIRIILIATGVILTFGLGYFIIQKIRGKASEFFSRLNPMNWGKDLGKFFASGAKGLAQWSNDVSKGIGSLTKQGISNVDKAVKNNPVLKDLGRNLKKGLKDIDKAGKEIRKVNDKNWKNFQKNYRKTVKTVNKGIGGNIIGKGIEKALKSIKFKPIKFKPLW